MKDTMVKSYECPICHEEITAEKLAILPEDEHELHEELLGNIGDHMFSCHEAKRTPDAEQLKARIAELEAALDKAAHQLYDYSGSCPSDLYDWEHPNTCIRECDRYDNPDEAWKCWRIWLMTQEEK